MLVRGKSTNTRVSTETAVGDRRGDTIFHVGIGQTWAFRTEDDVCRSSVYALDT